MLNHLLLIEWEAILSQHIETPLKLFDILLKFESSLILVKYLF